MTTNTLKWAGVVAGAGLAAFSHVAIAADDQDEAEAIKAAAQRDEALRKAFDSFPLIEQAFSTNGIPVFRKIEMNRSAKVTVNGKRYDGFRFKTSNHLTGDFVLAFYITGFPRATASQAAQSLYGMGILSRKDDGGSVGPDLYKFLPQDLTPFPTDARSGLAVLELAKSSLEPGKEYVIWFSFTDDQLLMCKTAYTFKKSDVEMKPNDLSALFGYKYNPPFGRDKEEGCFISTACIIATGRGEDCAELHLLRRFRDTYVSSLPTGRALIREYYQIAPVIVRAISEKPDAMVKFMRLYTRLVAPCVRLIESRNNEAALQHYISITRTLKAAYANCCRIV